MICERWLSQATADLLYYRYQCQNSRQEAEDGDDMDMEAARSAAIASTPTFGSDLSTTAPPGPVSRSITPPQARVTFGSAATAERASKPGGASQAAIDAAAKLRRSQRFAGTHTAPDCARIGDSTHFMPPERTSSPVPRTFSPTPMFEDGDEERLGVLWQRLDASLLSK